MDVTYDGDPLDLFCPQCQVNGTAWFSADEASCLRIDRIPDGFRLMQGQEGAVGPQFACIQCDAMASNL